MQSLLILSTCIVFSKYHHDWEGGTRQAGRLVLKKYWFFVVTKILFADLGQYVNFHVNSNICYGSIRGMIVRHTFLSLFFE